MIALKCVVIVPISVHLLHGCRRATPPSELILVLYVQWFAGHALLRVKNMRCITKVAEYVLRHAADAQLFATSLLKSVYE
jgi:hypothetical protein